jgi:hypothetical protein
LVLYPRQIPAPKPEQTRYVQPLAKFKEITKPAAHHGEIVNSLHQAGWGARLHSTAA